MKINSKNEIIQSPDAKIFAMITDFRKFGEFLPPQVQDWKAEEDYCEFSVSGMITVRVEIAEKTEFSRVVYTIKNDKSIPASFWIDISANSASASDVSLGMEADIPFFMQGMVKEPMQKMADMILQRIKEKAEKM